MSVYAMLNEHDTARVQRGQYCVWSGETFSKSEPSFMLVVTNDEVASVSIPCIDVFADAMEEFTLEAVDDGAAISPSGSVWYGAAHGGGTCPMCLDAVCDGRGAVVLERPHPHRENAVLTRAVVHPSCTGAVASVARRVWEHTDTVLPEQV